MRAAASGVDQLERVGRDLRAAFLDIGPLQPRIVINDRVYSEQTTPTAELAVLNRRTEVEHEFEHTWAGSTKRIRLHGTFNVRAGFDLRRELRVTMGSNEIVIHLPHATILSVDQQNVDVLEMNNGFWNPISPQDMQDELARLPQLTREKVAADDLIVEAEKTLARILTSRMHTETPLRLDFDSGEIAQ